MEKALEWWCCSEFGDTKTILVVFWKMIEVDDEENERETKTIPVLRYYRVFEIGEQVIGLERKRKEEKFEHNPIEEAEAVKTNYANSLTYSHLPGEAWYKPFDDHINVPPKEDFTKVHEYYSTLFHEMIHSTGHSDRLHRKGVTQDNSFGSKNYSKEELVAELGASMLCGLTGINNETIDNSASYIQSWLRALNNDKTLIVYASQQAQKACDHITG